MLTVSTYLDATASSACRPMAAVLAITAAAAADTSDSICGGRGTGGLTHPAASSPFIGRS